MSPYLRDIINRRDHDERWAPVGHMAACREVVAPEVIVGMVVRQNRDDWSEDRIIVVRGKQTRRGINMPDAQNDLRIPTFMRRAASGRITNE